MCPSAPYRLCTRCVMDTSDPEIGFDDAGVCSHCHFFDRVIRPRWRPEANSQGRLDAILARIRAHGRGHDYDCILGISGGIDSSYLAYLATRQWGLRVLGCHVNAGWNTETAEANIANLVNRCGMELCTHVVDWEEVRDLQIAYLKSGLANQDVPQDHVFFASLYETARQRGLKYVFTGANYATESILPAAWGYNAMDSVQLRAIHRRFGTAPLVSYRTISFFRRMIFLPYVAGQTVIRPLDFIPYDKQAAKALLQKEIGWKDYGLKHGESQFTRFFQNHWLPARFGYDKRRAHLSSMILSGLTTREEALAELARPLYEPRQLEQDMAFVSKKLGLSVDDLQGLLNAPRHTASEYPSEAWKYRLWTRLAGSRTVSRLAGAAKRLRQGMH